MDNFYNSEEIKALQDKLKERKIKLKKLIKNILESNIENESFPTKEEQVNYPRNEYISQSDRSNFNYGYQNVSELLAGSLDY